MNESHPSISVSSAKHVNSSGCLNDHCNRPRAKCYADPHRSSWPCLGREEWTAYRGRGHLKFTQNNHQNPKNIKAECRYNLHPASLFLRAYIQMIFGYPENMQECLWQHYSEESKQEGTEMLNSRGIVSQWNSLQWRILWVNLTDVIWAKDRRKRIYSIIFCLYEVQTGKKNSICSRS
jgi:hypothetical protein